MSDEKPSQSYPGILLLMNMAIVIAVMGGTLALYMFMSRGDLPEEPVARAVERHIGVTSFVTLFVLTPGFAIVALIAFIVHAATRGKYEEGTKSGGLIQAVQLIVCVAGLGLLSTPILVRMLTDAASPRFASARDITKLSVAKRTPKPVVEKQPSHGDRVLAVINSLPTLSDAQKPGAMEELWQLSTAVSQLPREEKGKLATWLEGGRDILLGTKDRAQQFLTLYTAVAPDKVAAIRADYLKRPAAFADPRTPEAVPLAVNAVRAGDLAQLQSMVSRGLDLSAGAGTAQGTSELLLRAGISANRVEIVKYLLSRGLSPNLKLGNSTAIVEAARAENSVPVLTLLLDSGADVNSAQVDGTTALMAAAQGGNVEGVKLLLARRANVNASNTRKVSALDSVRLYPREIKDSITHILTDAGAKRGGDLDR